MSIGDKILLLGIFTPFLIAYIWGGVKIHFRLKELSNKYEETKSELTISIRDHISDDKSRFDGIEKKLENMNIVLIETKTLVGLLVNNRLKD